MLFVGGEVGDVIADVIRQFAGTHESVVIVVGKTFEPFQNRVSKRAVSAAVLRAFERKFARTRRHQTQHFALRLAQFFDRTAYVGGLQITDAGGARHIGHEDHAPDFRELFIHQRLNFGHGKRGCGKILGIAVISQDE